MKYLVRVIPFENFHNYAIFEATPKEMNVLTRDMDLLNYGSPYLQKQKDSEYHVLLQAWDNQILHKEIPCYISNDDLMLKFFPLFKHRRDLAIFKRQGVNIL